MIATTPDVQPTTTGAIPEPIAPLPVDDRAEPRWSAVTRLAFRWSVLYFGTELVYESVGR